ncbi:MAG: gas vesicle protein K [Thermoanaerobaculia bacterium]
MSRDPEGPILVSSGDSELREALQFAEPAIPDRISADPEVVENGLARLVLAIIELVRQLLERQALRRMEAGTVTEAEIERLGLSLMKLEEKMEELKRTFGLEDDDLNLNLGPIRSLE